MSNTLDTIAAIKEALSAGRISTYESVTRTVHAADTKAVALYAWNAQVSAYLLMPLHICEVVVRNAASEAIEAIHGPGWPWNPGFATSLPQRLTGTRYSPFRDLQGVSGRHTTVGKVIPELKFVFWEQMFTARHDARIWQSEILRVFPNHEPGKTWFQLRSSVNADLQIIRQLRNRIAHHEPIFARNLNSEFEKIQRLVSIRSPIVSSWMMANQIASEFLKKPPFFCGGRSWTPSNSEIAEVAYSIWEQEGRCVGRETHDWERALALMNAR